MLVVELVGECFECVAWAANFMKRATKTNVLSKIFYINELKARFSLLLSDTCSARKREETVVLF